MSPAFAFAWSETLLLYSVLIAVASATLVADLAPRAHRSVVRLALTVIGAGVTTFVAMGALLQSAPVTLHRPLLDSLFLLSMQLIFVGTWVKSRSAKGGGAPDGGMGSHGRVRRHGAILVALLAALFAGHVAAILLDPRLVHVAFRINGGLTMVLALATLWLVRGPGRRSMTG